ncbi:MAG TPA: biotin-dependent carboxyltransferase family protein [Virgibacillus sp.]|nr:biotin-dependent carboxyltransferase family protein [Virgibacillus sp.]HLR68366.1 biotin-dependent carboxyltransferase family protein [Virgibacillus sp.]
MSDVKVNQQPLFKVKKPGLQSTIQDLGRIGYQQYGVVTSGAMDPFAMQVANILVGNYRNEACIEIALVGPDLIVLSDCTVAIAGADFNVELNGKPIKIWRTFKLREGDRLVFGAPNSGMRAYLSVSGGFDVPVVMGSKSTYTKAGIGEAITKGDILCGYAVKGLSGVGLVHTEVPIYEKKVELRVVEGPHTDRFTEEGLNIFYNGIHVVSPQSDRMGYRLESRAITHHDGADIWSDPIPMGAVQVPANGQPIILMADRQTTGGYTRIATVISEDVPKVAQLIPGGKIRFKSIDVDKAHKLYKKRERFLRNLKYFARRK